MICKKSFERVFRIQTIFARLSSGLVSREEVDLGACHTHSPGFTRGMFEDQVGVNTVVIVVIVRIPLSFYQSSFIPDPKKEWQ
jgi:hypothetical protein